MSKIAQGVWVAVSLLWLCGSGWAQEAASGKLDFDIQVQTVERALNEFAQATGLQLIFPAEEIGAEVRAPKVTGSFTARDALNKLLAGTGLGYEFVNARTVTIYSGKEGAQRDRRTSAAPAVYGDGVRVAQADTSSADSGSQASAPGENAQEDLKLEEVVVTAQKRAQSIKEVPLSITAISGKELTEAGVSNALDLSFSVPSMAVAEIQPGSQMIVIRGIGGERGGSALTGVYLDEMPLTGSTSGNGASIDLRTQDLERVEVLKGPQGTLFGESSVGGTVRYITKDPKLDRLEGKITGSYYGTEDGSPSYDLDGVLNLPLVENVFGLRIVTAYENRGGWIDKVPGAGEPVVDEDFNDNQTCETRVKGLWTPTDKMSFKVLAAVHRTDGGGSNLVNVAPARDSNFQPGFDVNSSQALKSDYEIYNLTATYDFGFAELVSSSSKYDIETANDVSQVFRGAPFFGTFVGVFTDEPVLIEIRVHDFVTDTSALSQEFRLTSTGSGSLKWTAGGFYKDSETRRENNGGGVRIAGRTLSSSAGGDVDVSTSRAWAAFGDASFAITDRMEIGGGLRYFHDERSVYQPSAVNVAATLVEGDFHKLTYRGFVSYRVFDDVRVYANTSTGFRSGGFNNPSDIAVGVPASFGPETVKAYELGVKASFLDGRAGADIALFKSDYIDIQGDTQAIYDGLTRQFTQNPGAAEVKGVEWAFGWMATDRWKLSFNGDVTDTEITQIDATLPNPVTIPGDRLNFVPDYSFSIASEYSLSWGQSINSVFHVDYNVQGESTDTFRGGLNLIPVGVAPVVRFLNASVRTEWNDWTFSLFSRNLLNEDKPIRAGNTDINAQARPRTIGLSIGKSF